MLGDFNQNGALDADDIDLLTGEVRAGTNSTAFDLNGDDLVNDVDRDFWVEDIAVAYTFFGDSNLDGEFSSSDFVTVFSKGLFEKQLPAGWDAGDWDGDGVFGSGDFVLAFQRRGYEIGPREAVAAVPEPGCVGWILFGIAGQVIGRLRRAQLSP